MKAVVASSRLGNHGHHDGSRNGRQLDAAKEPCLDQGAESTLAVEDNLYNKPSGTSLSEASSAPPPAEAENLESFRTEFSMGPVVAVNGTGCPS